MGPARLAGYDYCLIDENIAYAFDPASFTTERLVEVFVRGWEHSPEHRKNLLDPDIVDIGVAISYDAKSGKYYAVQDFGRPKAMAYRFTISNDTDDEISYRVDSKDFKLTPHYRMVHAALPAIGSGSDTYWHGRKRARRNLATD